VLSSSIFCTPSTATTSWMPARTWAAAVARAALLLAHAASVSHTGLGFMPMYSATTPGRDRCLWYSGTEPTTTASTSSRPMPASSREAWKAS
jgi:hypothetical protein